MFVLASAVTENWQNILLDQNKNNNWPYISACMFGLTVWLRACGGSSPVAPLFQQKGWLFSVGSEKYCWVLSLAKSSHLGCYQTRESHSRFLFCERKQLMFLVISIFDLWSHFNQKQGTCVLLVIYWRFLCFYKYDSMILGYTLTLPSVPQYMRIVTPCPCPPKSKFVQELWVLILIVG